MSIRYHIKEHMIIRDTEHAYEPAATLREELSQLGFLMLYNNVDIFSLELTADGTRYSFSGNRVTAAFHELLFAIDNASGLEIFFEYTQWFSSGWSLKKYPFALCDCIAQYFDESPEGKENVFYTMFNNADCNETAGSIAAYGMKNGRFYCHGLPAQNITVDEATGIWTSVSAPVVCEMDIDDDDAARQMEAVARELESRFDIDFLETKVSAAPFYSPETHSFNFTLSQAEVRSPADLADFLALCQQLMQLSGGEACYITEFEDLTGEEPRVLTLDFDNSSYTLQLYAL